MSYLCRAERQVLAKAYASSLDLNLSAPSRGTQVCRTSKPRLCVSSIVGCQQKQHGFFDCVYRFSTTTKQPSTDSVNEEKKCLVESGKVTMPLSSTTSMTDLPTHRQNLSMQKSKLSEHSLEGSGTSSSLCIDWLHFILD